MSDDKYPENEKLAMFDSERRAVAWFLEWLDEQGITLCERRGATDYLVPSGLQGEAIILKWLEIDPKKLEDERRAMLESLGE